MGRRASIIISAIDRASATLGKVGGAVAVMGAAAAAVGAVQFGRILVNGIGAATEAAGVQEAAEVKLAKSIANTGQAVATVLPDLKTYASTLQGLTGIGDEVILNNQALLIALGNLEGEGLKRATRAALDLSAANGVALKTSFELVGKAAAGEFGTLSRYGIIIDETVPKSQKFAAALELIEDRFGGQAEAKMQTYQGQLAGLQGHFGDLQEAIGGPFRDVFTEVISTVLSPMMQELTGAATNSTTFTYALLDLADGGLMAIAVLQDLVSELGDIGDAVGVPDLFIRMGTTVKHMAIATAAALGSTTAQLEQVKLSLTKGTPAYEAFMAGLEQSAMATGNRIAELRANIAKLREEVGEDTVPDVEIPVAPKLVEFDANDWLAEHFPVDDPIKIPVDLAPPEDLSDSQWFKDVLKVEGYWSSKHLDEAKKRGAADKKAGEESVQALQLFGDAAGDLFGQNKSLAVAQAIINTYVGATKALEQGGILGVAMMVAVIAAGMAQVQKIQSTNPTKAAGGYVVPGEPNRGDSVHALLAPGEIVLNQDQQRELLSGGSGGPMTVRVELGPNLRNLADMVSVEVQRGGARLVATELAGSRYRRT